MTHRLACTAAALLIGAQVAWAQGRDAGQVLADAQKAMGGSKLAAVNSLTATGRIQRTLPNGRSMETEFEISLLQPDKYLQRSVVAPMGNMSVYRHTGFNGETAIEEFDVPPNLAAGGMVMRFATAASMGGDPAKMTPEQRAEAARQRLLTNRQEYARLALGLFASAPPVFPLEITYAGEAESGDGKADALDVKGEGFEARLFIDAETHLPLMLSWMDKEPLTMQMVGGPGGTATVTAGGGTQTRVVQGGGNPANMSQEDRDKLQAELEARLKEAEAKRRTVEYRVFYGDYQEVGGVMLPHRISRWVDGKTTEDMVFDAFKLNPKINPKKFDPINK